MHVYAGLQQAPERARGCRLWPNLTLGGYSLLHSPFMLFFMEPSVSPAHLGSSFFRNEMAAELGQTLLDRKHKSF
jgi:hypothetical protein